MYFIGVVMLCIFSTYARSNSMYFIDALTVLIHILYRQTHILKTASFIRRIHILSLSSFWGRQNEYQLAGMIEPFEYPVSESRPIQDCAQ